MHYLGWGPLCEPCFCVFLCWELRRGPVGWLAVKVLWTPRWFTLLAVLRRWSRCWSYSLLLCGLFYEAFYVLPCVILFLCFFSPYSIVITSLGKVRTNLSAFCTFVRFVLVWFSLSSWCLGRAAVYDCGISWTFILPFFLICMDRLERCSAIFEKKITTFVILCLFSCTPILFFSKR